MYEVDFDVAWDAFEDRRGKPLPLEAEIRKHAKSWNVDVRSINYHGPGGGNPNITVRCADKSRLRVFLTWVLCGKDASDQDIESYVDPYLEHIMRKA